MFLAEVLEVAEEAPRFFGFDVFMILFTIVIAIGLFRLVRARKKNLFAIGFTTICLLIFLATDALMVMNWLGRL